MTDLSAETAPETGETRTPADPDPAGVRHVWTLGLPFRRPLLNLNRLGGKHWSVALRDKRALQDAAGYLARHYRLPRPIPVTITAELIYWPGNNTVHDADNMAPTLKALLDGLRAAKVLADDRGRYVRSAICTVIEKDVDPDHRRDARMALVLRQV